MLVNSDVEKARTVKALWAEKFQLEVQLAATRLVMVEATTSGASERATLEAVVKSAEDRVVVVQSTVDAAATEKAALEAKLSQAKETAAELC